MEKLKEYTIHIDYSGTREIKIKSSNSSDAAAMAEMIFNDEFYGPAAGQFDYSVHKPT